MNKYEVMYILNSQLEEEKRVELVESIHSIITNQKGEVVKVDEWGMKDFAYEIDHMTKGYYVVTKFLADVDTVKEFDRLLRINSNVVRYMIIRDEE